MSAIPTEVLKSLVIHIRKMLYDSDTSASYNEEFEILSEQFFTDPGGNLCYDIRAFFFLRFWYKYITSGREN